MLRILSPWIVVAIIVSSPAAGTDEDMELLRATQEAFASVALRLRPHLVRIHTVGGTQPLDVVPPSADDSDRDNPVPKRSPFKDSLGSDFLIADGATTGLVYSADGYIVTSSFNFAREPALISVTLPDGRRVAADLIARDQVRKIALLKVDATDLAVPEWVDIADVRVGQWALALGLGFGGDDPFVSVGIISALSRMQGTAVQADAKLSPANYGGPLCDIYGRVIGICVPMAQRPGELAGIELYDSGVGFALPKGRIDEIVARLRTGESIHRGWLGITSRANQSGGVSITNIAVPSPMDNAGAMPGDVITGAEGKTVRHFADLMKALYMIPAGDQVTLALKRDDSEISVTITLAKASELGPLLEPESTEDE